MVCIPCIVVPVFLFIWHRFLYPIVKKFWDPFGSGKGIEDPKDGSKEPQDKAGEKSQTTVAKDSGVKCPFSKSGENLTAKEGELDSQEAKKENLDDDFHLDTRSATVSHEFCENDDLLRKKMPKEKEFPDTLEGFCYKFEGSKLRHIRTNEPFNFVVKEGDQAYNQKHYEALGAAVTEEVYEMLEKRCGLQRLTVPVNAKKGKPTTFIFASEDWATKDKLLVLIHGSGRVRAGQWAQRLIINDCLESGTQIPFIERGLKEGYGILVMNTNDNSSTVNGKKKLIEGNENPIAHGLYVWEKFVSKAACSKIFLVAHSFGGIVTTKIFANYRKDFANRVVAVAMTDSVHFLSNPEHFGSLIKQSLNWVCSEKPLDTPISRRSHDVPCVSAGCTQHELTSWSSFNSIFKFFAKRNAMADGDTYPDSDAPEETKEPTPQEMPCDVPEGSQDSLPACKKVRQEEKAPGSPVCEEDVGGCHQMSESESQMSFLEEETGEGSDPPRQGSP